MTQNFRTLLGLAVLMGFLLSGCAAPGERQPIIGIFGVPQERFPEIRDAGFTHVLTRTTAAYLDAAQSNGLQVISYTTGFKSNELASAVRTFSRHPALWGWYLRDEPDLHRVPPREMREQHAFVKQRTSKPTLTMLASGAAVERYADVSDQLAFDWYPIPWGPLATLGRELRFARLAADGKPFYATLQAFSWTAAPELVRTDVPLRNPTPEELRCMAYLSLLHGSEGLLFTPTSSPRWKLREHPELWSALTNLVADVRRDFPIFEQRVGWWPTEIIYEREPQGMFNEIYEARLAAGMFELDQTIGAHAAGFYFVLINTSAESCEFSFKFPFPVDYLVSTAGGAEVLFVDEGLLREEFEPFQVKIYGPLKPEKRPEWLKR